MKPLAIIFCLLSLTATAVAQVPITWFSGTDFEAFEQANQVAVATNQHVYLPAGDYDFEGRSLDNPEKCGPLRVVGAGMARTTIHNIGTLWATDIVQVRDLALQDCGQAIVTNDTVTSIRVDKVRFQDCPVGIKSLRDRKDLLDNIQITNCEFTATKVHDDYISAVSFMAGGVSQVRIQDNLFKDLLTTSGPVVCIGVGDRHVDNIAQNHDIFVSGNIISSIGDTTRTDTSHGIVCLGVRISLKNNTVTDCYRTNALYIKGSNCTVMGNSIENPESGGITYKGHPTPDTPSNNTIVGNSVTGVCDYRPGIRIHGSAAVTGNTVEVALGEHPTSGGGFSFEVKTAKGTRGNMAATGNVFTGTRGVFLNGPLDTIFSNNVVTSDDYGLFFGEHGAVEDTYDSLIVSANTFNVKKYGAQCFGYHTNVAFTDNIINLTEAGPVSQSYFGASGCLTITDNIFNVISGQEPATNYVIGTILKPGSRVLKIADNTFNISVPLSRQVLNLGGGEGVNITIAGNNCNNWTETAIPSGVVLRETPDLLNIVHNTFKGPYSRIVFLEPSVNVDQHWKDISIDHNRIFSLHYLLVANSSAQIDTLTIRGNLLHDSSYNWHSNQTIGCEVIEGNSDLIPLPAGMPPTED